MDKSKKRFLKNIGIIMFSQILIKVIGVFYKLYLTNKTSYGDMGNAIYSATFQIYAIFLTMSSIGVPNAISKMVSDKLGKNDVSGAYRILKIGLIIFVPIGFIGSMILHIFAEDIANRYLGMPEVKNVLIIISPSIFFVSIEAVLRGYFYGKENMKIIARAQIIEQITKTVLTILVIELISNMSSETLLLVMSVAAITTISNIVNVSYLMKYYLKHRKEIWREIIRNKYKNKEKIKEIIKKICQVSVPITIIALLLSINRTVDAFTIVKILSTYLTETGATLQYGIWSGKVETLINLPLSINGALSTALIPAVSIANAEGKLLEAKTRIQEAIKVSIYIGLPALAVLFVFPKEILQLLFPNALQGNELLRISSLSVILITLIQTLSGAIQGFGENRILIKALIFGGITKVVLNLLLLNIQSIGIIGASISTIISYFVTIIILLYNVNKKLRISVNLIIEALFPIMITITMIIIIYFFYQILGISKINFLISLFLGGIFYLLASYRRLVVNSHQSGT